MCRVYHVKWQAGWSTSWNQDCREKYQYLQIHRWYHPCGKKQRQLKSLLMKVKEKNEKVGLKLNIQGALFIPLLMSTSEALSVPFPRLIKLLHKSSWVIKPGPWSWSSIFFRDHKYDTVHCKLSISSWYFKPLYFGVVYIIAMTIRICPAVFHFPCPLE